MIQDQKNYYGYVYLTLDQKENKIYIGQKKGLIEKTENYFGSGDIIRRIVKKRGTYFLKKIILGVCETKEELNKCELECKYFFNALDPLYGYNISIRDEAPMAGRNHSEETLIKLSESHKGYITSESTKKLLSEINKGKTNNPMKGRKHSEETKKKMSESGKKKKPLSAQSRRKLSNSKKNKKKSLEAREKMSKSRKNTKQKESTKIKRGLRYLGKNNYRYKKVNYKLLILNYFNFIPFKKLLSLHNEENIKIATSTLKRFLDILNFPLNTLQMKLKPQRELYLKFVEENKHKIQWYIDNYERLENEYYINIMIEKLKELEKLDNVNYLFIE